MIEKSQKDIKTITIKEKDGSEILKIESKKYILNLSLVNQNNHIIISFSPKDKNENNQNNFNSEITHKKKFSEFSSIDSYFEIFKDNIPLLFKHLKKLFTLKLFSVDFNNINDEYITIYLFCLKENKIKLIKIILSNINSKKDNKKSKSKSLGSLSNKEIIDLNNYNSRDKQKNLGPGPLCKNKKSNYNNPNDNNIYFYYKIKKKNLQYHLFVNKNEYVTKNYKEIVFKIIEKENDNDLGIEYYAYFNLVDFFELYESYFNLFNYSIDDIYDDLLIILYNHNYRIEKFSDNVKLYVNVINTGQNKNSYYYGIYIYGKKKEKERGEDEINNKISEYFNKIVDYVIKFGGNLEDENIKNLVNNPNKDKNLIQFSNIENKNKKENKIVIHNQDSYKKFEIKKNKQISGNKNNLKIEHFFKNDLNKEIYENKFNNKNIVIDNNIIILNKKNLSLNLIEEKKSVNNLEKKVIINNKNDNQNNEYYFSNNLSLDNHIRLDNNKRIVNNGILLIDNKVENKLDNIPDKSQKESLYLINNISHIIDNNDIIYNSIFLNKKRNLKYLYFNNNFYKKLSSLSIEQYLKRSKKIGENESFLNDKQLKLIINKIEKNIQEFRFINLKINLKIIYKINYDNIKDNNNSTKFIKEFYEKSNNIKNLIFLIKTSENKIFGGFTHFGFNLYDLESIEKGLGEENKININYYDQNSFVFSIDRMKIYDLAENNSSNIFCSSNKLPEFKNQIYFEKNNLKFGYTGKKKIGYLVDEDYELNNGEKIYYISQIQLINIYSN